jgi:hypothetical protein
VLPGFLSHEDQRSLARWALADHARPPNETNLDTHYILPTTGIWLTSIDPLSSSQIIHPRASSAEKQLSRPTQSTRRTLIENTPASPSSFATLAATPKPPASASASLAPVPAHELVRKLRWANVGWFYHWGEKQYDFSRPKVPVHDRVAVICKQAIRGVDWAKVFDGGEGAWPEGEVGWSTWADDYGRLVAMIPLTCMMTSEVEPDAGIVNYYQTKDTLMGHVDRSEVCATAPLVSISYVSRLQLFRCYSNHLCRLGLSAVFLIGGADRETSPHALVLRSGDALIMAGPRCRRAFHGVPRVLENSLPAHLDNTGDETWIPYAEYLAHARINVNVRQVFPKGFNPSMNAHTS